MRVYEKVWTDNVVIQKFRVNIRQVAIHVVQHVALQMLPSGYTALVLKKHTVIVFSSTKGVGPPHVPAATPV